MNKSFLLLIILISACTHFNSLPNTAGMEIQEVNSRERLGYEKLHSDLINLKNNLKTQQYENEFIKLKSKNPISRLIYLFFKNRSAVFKPSPHDEMNLLPYIGKVKNIEIRSRSDYFNSDEESEKMALNRALAVKQYLVARGVSASIISIHYDVNDDSMEEEQKNALYEVNGPVVVELFFK